MFEHLLMDTFEPGFPFLRRGSLLQSLSNRPACSASSVRYKCSYHTAGASLELVPSVSLIEATHRTGSTARLNFEIVSFDLEPLELGWSVAANVRFPSIPPTRVVASFE
jgi:hypothetical protein